MMIIGLWIVKFIHMLKIQIKQTVNIVLKNMKK